MDHSSPLFLILLLLIAGCQCAFRGGSITWSLNANSNTVTFTLTAYWNPAQVQNSLFINFGDGTAAQSFNFPTVSSTSEYVTVSGSINYTYKSAGKYTAYFSDCCRIVNLRAGGNAPYKISTTVTVAGVYDQSAIVSIPPIIDFGAGPNTFPFVSSIPAKFTFTLSSASGLSYPAPYYIFNNYALPPGPQLSSPTGSSVGILSWTTSVKDYGMWAASVTITTTTGSVASDFIIRVNNGSTTADLPQVILPSQSTYALTTGESVSFTVSCNSAAGNDLFSLSTPNLYPGLTLNGGTVNSLNITAGTPVTINWTPAIANGAKNQQFILTFTCRNVLSYLSSSSCVTVSVGLPLILTPPPPATIECHPACGCIEDVGTATATDGCCGTPVITYSDAPSGSCGVHFNRTWYAWNRCGQNVSATQDIYVNDNIPPYFTSVPDNQVVECYAMSAVVLFDSPFASDACSGSNGVTIVNIDSSSNGTSSCNNVITRTFIATDQCGNSANATQIITVQDSGIPLVTIDTEAPLIVACPSNIGAFAGIVTAIDDCDGTNNTITYVDVPSSILCGNFTRTWTAIDECGNQGTYSADLTIWHSTPPTITLASYYNIPQCPADVAHVPVPTADSFCGNALQPTQTGNTQYFNNNNCYNSAQRVWSVTDECGIPNTITETITIDDTTPPTVSPPPSYSIECVYAPHCDAGVFPYAPVSTGGWATGTDNCNQNVTISYADTSAVQQCTTVITRNWTGVDTCGNGAWALQTITITDTTKPEFHVPSDYTGECPADVTNAQTVDTSTIYDCHLPVTLNYIDTLLSGSTYDTCGDRVIQRNWTADDGCGNIAWAIQIITIEDNIPPNITVPCDITVECSTSPALIDKCGTATGVDNCGVVDDSETTHVDYVWANGNGLTRVWTIYDGCGNSATGNQTIYFDNNKPFLTCPANISVPCLSASTTATTGHATANDQCSGNLTTSYTDSTTGTCPTVITRTWSATDSTTGKTSTCQQIITIEHFGVGPIIKPHEDDTVQCEFQAQPITTGGCCATPICPEDDVTIPTYEDTVVGTICTNGRKILRNWTSSDQCGNSVSEVQVITIDDTTAPILSVPKDCTVTCRFNAVAGVNGTGTASATDNCDADGNPINVKYSDSVTPSANNCPSSITRTWTATDCSGNSATGVQTITIDEDVPQFIGNPPKTLPPVQCVDCVQYPPLQAVDSCGNVIAAVAQVSSAGTCPTTFTIKWTATDTCGRNNYYIQTIVANDTIAPVIDSSQIQDITVECDSDIPTDGVVTASDNCKGVGVPTFTDHAAPSNCSCNQCASTILRTWTVVDECGNPSAPVLQKITSRKTKPPTVTAPKNVTIGCGTSYSPDISGTGVAVGVDSCGTQLYVEPHDVTVTSGYGSFVIYRTWNATDNCDQTTSVTQVITVNPSGSNSGITITVPPDCNLVCDSNMSVEICGVATVTSTCGNVTVVPSMSAACPVTPGAYVRQWTAYRNGVATSVVAYQNIYVTDCKPCGDEIINVPQSPCKLAPTTVSVTPQITVTDLDLPCDVITLTWSWGDGHTDIQKCDPNTPDAQHCTFGADNSVTTSYTHSYSAAGVYTIEVLITDLRSTDIVENVDQGDTWSRYRTYYTVVNPFAGYLSGKLYLDADLSDYGDSTDDKKRGTCSSNWLIAGQSSNSTGNSGYSYASCDGTAQFLFNAKFTQSPTGATQAVGDTLFSWDSCCGGLTFESENITHLTLFGNGNSAIWTGYGSYSNFPALGQVPFTAYGATTGTTGAIQNAQAFYIIVTDNAGNVLINTDPCFPAITDITVLPSTLPNTVITSSASGDQSVFTIYNPSQTTISALTGETSTGASSVPVGLIVGIVLGILVFIVIVAIIIYFLLKAGASTNAASTEKFVSM